MSERTDKIFSGSLNQHDTSCIVRTRLWRLRKHNLIFKWGTWSDKVMPGQTYLSFPISEIFEEAHRSSMVTSQMRKTVVSEEGKNPCRTLLTLPAECFCSPYGMKILDKFILSCNGWYLR
jgi:hypothetical protein